MKNLKIGYEFRWVFGFAIDYDNCVLTIVLPFLAIEFVWKKLTYQK